MGLRLNAIGRQLMGKRFQGVLNAAQRPRGTPSTCAVTNSQPAPPGEHWVGLGVFRDREGSVRVMGYDTYGRNEAFEHERLLDVDTWTRGDTEQTRDSQVCGAMCLAWCLIFLRCGHEAAAQV